MIGWIAGVGPICKRITLKVQQGLSLKMIWRYLQMLGKSYLNFLQDCSPQHNMVGISPVDSEFQTQKLQQSCIPYKMWFLQFVPNIAAKEPFEPQLGPYTLWPVQDLSR